AVLQNIHPRIYYGEDASPGEFPSIVSLQVENMHSCGATIFNSEWIISAAHCVVDADVSKLSVVAGTIDLRNNGSVHQVTAAIPHEGYDPNNYFINDIAVLIPSSAVELNTTSALANYATEAGNEEKKLADVSKLSVVAGTIDLRNNGSVHQVTAAIPHEGYDPNNYFINDIAVLKVTPQLLFDGVNIEAVTLPSSGESDLVIPDILQKTNLFVDSTDDCYRKMDPGDSGGPLYASGVEIGIVSWSSGGCGSRNSPMIYINRPPKQVPVYLCRRVDTKQIEKVIERLTQRVCCQGRVAVWPYQFKSSLDAVIKESTRTMSEGKDIFTKGEDEKLVEMFSKFPCIYDVSSPIYKDQTVKNHA
ncbi:unnamed protein product, partial [Timema podura]|nr:unnamed protein product [Timema podura]